MVPRESYVTERVGMRLAVTIDLHGRVHYGKDDIGVGHAVTVLGEQVSDAYLEEQRADGVSYPFALPTGDDLAGALEQFANLFAAKTLLLQGGGTINGAFFRHQQINEFSTLIRPAIDGMAAADGVR